MNTIKSTWIGWGSLCAAGGGAYYFAKRSINADRAEKHRAMLARQESQAKMEDAERMARTGGTAPPASSSASIISSKFAAPVSEKAPTWTDQKKKEEEKFRNGDDVGSPSTEASRDPAPTRHAPENEAQGISEKGKYEATEVYRSKKGNRFS